MPTLHFQANWDENALAGNTKSLCSTVTVWFISHLDVDVGVEADVHRSSAEKLL